MKIYKTHGYIGRVVYIWNIRNSFFWGTARLLNGNLALWFGPLTIYIRPKY